MKSRLLLGIVAVATLLLGLAVPVITASAGFSGTIYTIDVDHTPPTGHNFSYLDFFPRENVSVHTGDVIGFQWPSVPDGFHTATVLQDGESPPDAWNNNPLFIPDDDDGDGQLQANPAVFAPSDPSCGNTDANACAYDGTTDLNSGANGNDGEAGYFVRFNVGAGTTVNYVCLIHPGMAATVDVVDAGTTASTQDELDAAAETQFNEDTTGALAAETAASATSTTTNSDGTKTVTMTAGTAAPHVEVLEFLPMNVQVNAGDTVKYATKGTDPHTVTFPMGTDEGEPLELVCEGDPDFEPDPGQNPPCGDPSLIEQHVDLAPGGATVSATPTTFGTSGIIGVPGTPSDYSYTFPNAGTFDYMCHLHENGMLGSITAVSVGGGTTTTTTTTAGGGTETAPVATPVSAEPTLTG